ncbi:MAG: serine/threonine-protein phosphatase, partial [Verrucomicrobia bacterium]|nr:serine/threonine-protein phosphatase [Verrucomicrobiota bacterium]
ETLLSYWRRHGATSVEEAEIYLHESLMVANEAVALRASQERALRGMGSTVCCLLRFEDLMIHAHVGDSRIYLCRNQSLQQLTCDHSLLAQLIASGQVGQEEAQRFLYKHIITRAIGTRKRVKADVGHLLLEEGDLYLLCSDGLTDLVSDEEILSHLTATATLEERAHRLVEVANAAGGNDNITALLVACQST